MRLRRSDWIAPLLCALIAAGAYIVMIVVTG